MKRKGTKQNESELNISKTEKSTKRNETEMKESEDIFVKQDKEPNETVRNLICSLELIILSKLNKIYIT